MNVNVTKVGSWPAARRILHGGKRVKDALDKALLEEAQCFRTKIVEGLREGAPGGKVLAPLAPTTLAIRKFQGFGGTKPLIVGGDLRNSMTVVKQRDAVFVGVLRTAKAGSGQSLANVAAVHDFGSRPIVLKLTPKVRRFLHAAFRAAGLDRPAGDRPGTCIAVIRVPARPVLRPVFDRWKHPADVSKRFLDRLARNLGGDFGR